MRLRLLFLYILILAISANVYSAANRETLTISGILKDTSGNFLNGDYNIDFNIITSSNVTVYDENHNGSQAPKVTVSNGYFAVTLGDTNVLPVTLFNGSDYNLTVSVNSNGWMAPSMRLTSVASAVTAVRAVDFNIVNDLNVTRNILVLGDINFGTNSSFDYDTTNTTLWIRSPVSIAGNLNMQNSYNIWTGNLIAAYDVNVGNNVNIQDDLNVVGGDLWINQRHLYDDGTYLGVAGGGLYLNSNPIDGFSYVASAQSGAYMRLTSASSYLLLDSGKIHTYDLNVGNDLNLGRNFNSNKTKAIITPAQAEGSNILTNAGFENWTGGNPDDWNVDGLGGSSTITQEGAIVNSGSSAVKATLNADGNSVLIQQNQTGLTAGTEYALSLFYRKGDASSADATIDILFFNGPWINSTKVWNYTTASWDAYTHGVTDLTTNNSVDIDAIPITYTYGSSEGHIDNVTVPTGSDGNLNVILVFRSNTGSDIIYVDDINIYTPVTDATYSDVNIFNFLSTFSDVNLTINDYIFRFMTDNGTVTQFGMKGNKSFDINAIDFNFSSKPVLVGDGNFELSKRQALSEYTGMTKLATVSDINGGITGTYTLYTVPSGKKAVVKEIFMRITNYVAATSTSLDFNFGTTAPEYDEWGNARNITMSGIGINTFNSIPFSTSSPTSPNTILTSGQIFKLSLKPGNASDDYTFALDLFGYLVD